MTQPDLGGPASGRGRTPLPGQALRCLTEVSLWLSMAGLATIVIAFNFEVVARYFFNAPSRWSAELVSYLLLVVTFLAMPRLTRDGGHVAVTVLLEALPAGGKRWGERAIMLLGAVICAAMAWIAAEETLRQIERNVRMMAAIPVPKAAVSAWIVWGLGLSSLEFLALGTRRTGLEGHTP